MAELLRKARDSVIGIIRAILSATILERDRVTIGKEGETHKVTRLTVGTVLAIALAVAAITLAAHPDSRESGREIIINIMSGDAVSQSDNGPIGVTGPIFDLAPQPIQHAIRDHFPPHQWENAAVIGKCESGFNALAHNNSNIEDSRGIWQINIRANTDFAESDLWSVDENARAASIIYERQGWQAWKTCANTHGIE